MINGAPKPSWTEDLKQGQIKSAGEQIMSQVSNLFRKLKGDEDGAALIEYTVLLGILVVAVIATITLVGTWVSGQWTTLNAALPT